MGERAKETKGMMKCPICGEAADMRFRPFCSERCALLDLSGWFNEYYRIATRETVDEESKGMIDPADNGGDGKNTVH